MFFLVCQCPGVIDVEDVKNMAEQPIVFAMANPTPEIMPEDAAPYVAVMATGSIGLSESDQQRALFSRDLSRSTRVSRLTY